MGLARKNGGWVDRAIGRCRRGVRRVLNGN